MEVKPNDEILIIEMQGEPRYANKCGVVERIDDTGQIHGSWGGCALREGEDNFIDIEDHLQYLETLRQSGATNMFGATPYLQSEFDMPKDQALAVLNYWMNNYNRLCEKYGWR